MKTVPAALVFVLLIAAGCQGNEQPLTTKPRPSDTSKFYPLAHYFKKQVEYVDLRNFLVYKITVKDGKKDSGVLTKEQFINFAKIFISRSLTEQGIKALYTETVFQDLSTGSYTLNYSPTDPRAEVKNIDILLDEGTQIVKRVFIKSVYTRGDTTIAEQCNWKADKSFQVNRSMKTSHGYTGTELNYINWNDRP